MVDIRRMKPEDIDQVEVLEKENFSHPWTHEDFSTYVDRSGAVFLVAQRGDRILGYIGLITAADEGDITNVSVSKNARKQGIGNRLVSRVLEEGEKLGIARIFLEVRAGNEAAIQLYKNQGFQQIGIRKAYYQDPAEDALLMLKNIISEVN